MLRFPDGMRDRIRDEAEKNGRSMNAELISRLEQSFDPKPAVHFNDETLRPIAKAMARAFVETLKVTVEKANNADIDFKEIEAYFERQLEGKG